MIDITQEKFKELSHDLLKRITLKVKDTLRDSKAEKIDQVVYIGGGSKMPMIKETLGKAFPDSEHYYGADSEYAIAVGACIHALQLYQDKV